MCPGTRCFGINTGRPFTTGRLLSFCILPSSVSTSDCSFLNCRTVCTFPHRISRWVSFVLLEVTLLSGIESVVVPDIVIISIPVHANGLSSSEPHKCLLVMYLHAELRTCGYEYLRASLHCRCRCPCRLRCFLYSCHCRHINHPSLLTSFPSFP